MTEAAPSSTAERVLIAVLGTGIAGFVVIHSVALAQGVGGRTLALFRAMWLFGLVVLVGFLAVRFLYRRGE